MIQRNLPLRKISLPKADRLVPYIERIDASGIYSNFGPLEREFELRLAEHFGCRSGELVVLANATVALTVALSALELTPGRKCLMPSLTFVATPAAAIAAGLTPFFMDIDREQWTALPRQAEDALAAAGGREEVAAVFPVSTYGAPVDVAGWQAFQDRTGVPVVIDAAWCFDSARLGPIPQCISMHATKVFGTGEGGLVLGPDIQAVTAIRRRANFGILPDRRVPTAGFNGKMSEYGAAVGLAGLDEWPDRRKQTLELQARYLEALKSVSGLAVMPGLDNTWAGGTIAVAMQDPVTALSGRLNESGIEARHWWGRPCHLQEVYLKCGRTDLTVTEWLSERMLNLPFWLGLSQEDVNRVAEGLAAGAGHPRGTRTTS